MPHSSIVEIVSKNPFLLSNVCQYRNHCNIKLHEKKIIGVSLFTPPHRVNGNDTMTIRWNVTDGCTDCLTWTPQQMSFNGQNFNDVQNLTFFRRKQSTSISLSPIFVGGGFEMVSTETNGISFI